MKSKAGQLSKNELKALHHMQRRAIRDRLGEFAAVPSGEYFYELVYCLLTPQSSAVNAGKAVHHLKENEFHQQEIDPEQLLHQKEFYIRFHKTKAKHLLRLKEQFPVIASHLSNGSSSHELREWLLQNTKGPGWKETSHLFPHIEQPNP